jgi:hypothetical protein
MRARRRHEEERQDGESPDHQAISWAAWSLTKTGWVVITGVDLSGRLAAAAESRPGTPTSSGLGSDARQERCEGRPDFRIRRVFAPLLHHALSLAPLDVR